MGGGGSIERGIIGKDIRVWKMSFDLILTRFREISTEPWLNYDSIQQKSDSINLKNQTCCYPGDQSINLTTPHFFKIRIKAEIWQIAIITKNRLEILKWHRKMCEIT